MSGKVSGTVRIRKEGPVAVITMDHPPANVLSPRIRQGLMASLADAAADPAIRAVVIGRGAGGFPGLVNPREYDSELAIPAPVDLAEAIENMTKPVIALVSGQVLGAAAELALAAHGRVAVDQTLIGFRDLHIGLPPSAGATQRLPRLLGAERALTLLLSGRSLRVESAVVAPLFDAVLPAERADEAARQIALELAEVGAWPRSCDRVLGFADPGAFQAEVNRRRAVLPDPANPIAEAIIQSVEASLLFPFEAGMTLEQDLFAELATSERSRGMRHIAVAETRVNAGINAPPVALVGLWRTGPGAARLVASLLAQGISVMPYEPDSLLAGRFDAALRENLASRGGRLGAPALDGALERLVPVAAPGDLAKAEVIFDVSVDDIEVKRAALAEIDAVAGPGALILSTTRYLDVAALAPERLRGRVVGLHLPARSYSARLAELVATAAVSKPVFARARQLMVQLGRMAVRVTPSDGLAGPAMAGALLDAADALVRYGAEPRAIDAALHHRGLIRGAYPMLSDMDGDAHADRQDRRGRSNGLSSLIARAGLRLNTGQDDDSESDALASLVNEARGGAAPGAHPWTGGEIWTAVLAAMVNEGARLLDKGIAARPLALDVVMVQGYGFPRTLGGPMQAADMLGLFTLVRAMKALAPLDPDLWQEHPLIVQLHKDGRSFDDLNG
ncbi:enoyl-CoA hydratase-related protein [Pseudooceanicola sp.]|uniref:enoyl-CoA hydratase-related protein n=1 Tax=Pseudooceanicola sp. TaxID=1914328 RepID=UPI00260EACA8|nr:enoyl-CoA hydratase-related protein [Pseudooceanicola sp.]MDF1854893.1 enoyl-CoA hydratase-related protein [Pseudooceanicola sp.]